MIEHQNSSERTFQIFAHFLRNFQTLEGLRENQEKIFKKPKRKLSSFAPKSIYVFSTFCYNNVFLAICEQLNCPMASFNMKWIKFKAKPNHWTTCMGVGSGGKGPWYTWYRYSRKRLNSTIFRSFLLIFGLFSVAPSSPGNVSADALNHMLFGLFLSLHQ